MTSNVLPLHFASSQASSSQNSNVENFKLDCHNPFKIPFKILRTLLSNPQTQMGMVINTKWAIPWFIGRNFDGYKFYQPQVKIDKL